MWVLWSFNKTVCEIAKQYKQPIYKQINKEKIYK